jgi:hypothetical protein
MKISKDVPPELIAMCKAIDYVKISSAAQNNFLSQLANLGKKYLKEIPKTSDQFNNVPIPGAPDDLGRILSRFDYKIPFWQKTLALGLIKSYLNNKANNIPLKYRV